MAGTPASPVACARSAQRAGDAVVELYGLDHIGGCPYRRGNEVIGRRLDAGQEELPARLDVVFGLKIVALVDRPDEGALLQVLDVRGVDVEPERKDLALQVLLGYELSDLSRAPVAVKIKLD